MRSWRERHPEWEHFLWTSSRLPCFRLGHVFAALTSEEARREIVRTEVLGQFGGIAPEPEAECTGEFDDIAAAADAFIVPGPGDKVIFGCCRAHPLARAMSRTILQGSRKHEKNGDGAMLPGLLAEIHEPGSSFSNLRRPDLGTRVAWHSLHCADAAADYSPESLVIVVKTIQRKVSYIHQTLASMFAADPWVRRTGEVLLLVGGEDHSYLSDYLHHENIRVISMTEAELERLRPINRMKARAALNRCRSLRIPLEGKIGVLILEDDVVCKDNFIRRLLATIREMEQDFGLRDYGLALFSPFDFEAIAGTFTGKRFCEYNGSPFACTQGMYYPAHIAPRLADAVDRCSIENYEMAGDILVGEELKGKLFATPRFLVQHIGDVSTGLGGTTMDQTVFHRPYLLRDPAHGDVPTLPCYPGVQPMSLAPFPEGASNPGRKL